MCLSPSTSSRNCPSSGCNRWACWPTMSTSLARQPSRSTKTESTSPRNSSVSVPRGNDNSMWLNRTCAMPCPTPTARQGARSAERVGNRQVLYPGYEMRLRPLRVAGGFDVIDAGEQAGEHRADLAAGELGAQGEVVAEPERDP